MDTLSGDPRLLHALLEQFVSFETPFVRTSREAINYLKASRVISQFTRCKLGFERELTRLLLNTHV